MSASRAATLLLGLSVALAAVIAACRTPPASRFPHRAHLVDLPCGTPESPQCLTCNSCHTPSQVPRTGSVPGAKLCDGCHHDDGPPPKTMLVARVDRPYGEIAFDHDRHLAMASIQGQCVPCHAGVVTPGAASIPPMSQCFTCHEHQEEWNRGECAPCHQPHDLDRILPQTFLRHEGTFARNHGSAATEQKQLCQACHTQAECNECHDVTQNLTVERRHPASLERSFVHRADFMVRHGIEAQSQPATCARCHEPSTCDSCHAEHGVSGNLLNARNPHPPGWIGTDTQSGDFHGREARRDILLCAGCHEQGPATNCIRCHKVGAYGGNPHPRGWKGSRSDNSEMCRYCHE